VQTPFALLRAAKRENAKRRLPYIAIHLPFTGQLPPLPRRQPVRRKLFCTASKGALCELGTSRLGEIVLRSSHGRQLSALDHNAFELLIDRDTVTSLSVRHGLALGVLSTQSIKLDSQVGWSMLALAPAWIAARVVCATKGWSGAPSASNRTHARCTREKVLPCGGRMFAGATANDYSVAWHWRVTYPAGVPAHDFVPMIRSSLLRRKITRPSAARTSHLPTFWVVGKLPRRWNQPHLCRVHKGTRRRGSSMKIAQIAPLMRERTATPVCWDRAHRLLPYRGARAAGTRERRCQDRC
jgi:hypothetical protein